MKAKRELKAIERQQKAAKKAALIEERKQQREARKAAKPKVSKTFLTRSKTACGTQHSESSSNECTVCFGNYDDDMSDDGTPSNGCMKIAPPHLCLWCHFHIASCICAMLYKSSSTMLQCVPHYDSKCLI